MSGSIGILGGTFDPVHNGHLSTAMLARDHFSLDHVVFIPTGTPPHKRTVNASAQDRLQMLRSALQGVCGFEIYEGEIARSGYSYTIDTLKILHKHYGTQPFHYIIGSDNLSEIHTWRSYEQILEKVILCVAGRPPYSQTQPTPALKNARVEFFPSPEWGLSSTALRRYLENGCSCRFLIPDTVLAYIKEKKLYGYQIR
ncbi:MAG: nicotinate-nucleotide adenylyltransferase [Chitinispirillaceae bacterium]